MRLALTSGTLRLYLLNPLTLIHFTGKQLFNSIKGVAARLIQYTGPQARVEQMLSKLEHQYGQVASSDVLIQNVSNDVREK